MSKKRSKKAPQDPVPVPVAKAESRCVIAIRAPLQLRDRLRAAAGWGKQTEFIYGAIMTAIEKAEKAK